MSRMTIIIAAGLALVAILPAVSAQAQAPRTFVSAAGNDSNPCSFAAPCRHFQAAVDATSAGGEVDALDPAGYGPITISHAITIEGQGWSYIAPPAGGNGITINAVSGNVSIHGVSLNGAGITGATNGIVFNSGGSLTVTDCVVQNFVNFGLATQANGILLQPASGTTVNFVITNTIISNNGFVGIYYLPPSGSSATANVVIDHVVVTNNAFGIAVDTNGANGSATLGISNSTASNHNILPSSAGLFIKNSSSPVAVSIDNCNISGNINGITTEGSPKVLLGRSVITNNFGNSISNASSTFFTYQNNQINLNGNGNNINGDALVMLPFQ